MTSTRQERYARAEPIGTTATTTMTKIDDGGHLQNREYYFGQVYGPGPFKGILFGQTFLLIFAGVALCFSFIFLIVFLFELHQTHLYFWPWKISDFMFSMTACASYIILGFIEAYYSTGAWANNCNDVGADGIIHNHCRTIYEWVFASLLSFFNGFLYGISAFLAHRNQYS
ncbi:unnamed protein product [Acanthocheilonema viteae]|uniref:MARVEL domain-containing protein n=1 Tax=Acanthocheilonema viteae TaxID=6277 RepID=A0A498SJH6_ACAVI|nr:unnamed protein product [Acanthocheilonema viteae]